jgi:hypothetical protein
VFEIAFSFVLAFLLSIPLFIHDKKKQTKANQPAKQFTTPPSSHSIERFRGRGIP